MRINASRFDAGRASGSVAFCAASGIQSSCATHPAHNFPAVVSPLQHRRGTHKLFRFSAGFPRMSGACRTAKSARWQPLLTYG
jgi:hypothetical protein